MNIRFDYLQHHLEYENGKLNFILNIKKVDME